MKIFTLLTREDSPSSLVLLLVRKKLDFTDDIDKAIY
jgi:hypothetical protein